MSDGLIRREQNLSRGDIKLTQMGYTSTTSLTIAAEYLEANGKIYNIQTPITHNMTSLASAYDLHYIYIDDSASTAPAPVIIDSTTEPTYSAAKGGWYNGDDRCICALPSTNGAATLIYFESEIIGNLIQIKIPGRTEAPIMANLQAPAGGVWQTPNTNDADALTPVNATAIFLNQYGADTGSFAYVDAVSKEWGDVNPNIFNGDLIGYSGGVAQTTHWVTLGASRKIYIAGEADDDNSMLAWIAGFIIQI